MASFGEGLARVEREYKQRVDGFEREYHSSVQWSQEIFESLAADVQKEAAERIASTEPEAADCIASIQLEAASYITSLEVERDGRNVCYRKHLDARTAWYRRVFTGVRASFLKGVIGECRRIERDCIKRVESFEKLCERHEDDETQCRAAAAQGVEAQELREEVQKLLEENPEHFKEKTGRSNAAADNYGVTTHTGVGDQPGGAAEGESSGEAHANGDRVFEDPSATTAESVPSSPEIPLANRHQGGPSSRRRTFEEAFA